jgi:energy-coupling factor transporter ATP-binding protein EcfA2
MDLNSLPDFKLDESEIPNVRIKSIRFQNYKAFEDHTVTFGDEAPELFACLIGPNGCGKTTILDIIQLIFSRFDGIEQNRLKVLLGKSVRHVDGKQNGIYGDDDFLVTAHIESDIGNYEVQINKEGFIKDHPEEIKSLVYRLCFYARFDQELKTFQLERKQWPLFKELFEAVTGFEAKEIEGVFDQSDDPVQAELLSKYVLSFDVHKPDETIRHTECSAGERKIIKSFSTLLNKEYTPRIILVDNVAMHVESGRHLELIQSMKRCFPNSQIFATTHSYHISRNFGVRSELHDLRLIKVPDLIKKSQWRLYLMDEVQDAMAKLNAIVLNGGDTNDSVAKHIAKGQSLLDDLMYNRDEDLPNKVSDFLQKVADFFVRDIVAYFGR